MSEGAAGDVVFDYDGSLQLARALWSAAQQVRDAARARNGLAAIALQKWSGPYAQQFSTRMNGEAEDAPLVAQSLEIEAQLWAQAWKVAVDQQNKINRVRAIESTQDERGWFERNVGDRFLGDDSADHVAPFVPASTPQPPQFQPTSSIVSYQ